MNMKDTSTSKVAIIVLNWNGIDDTLRAVESLARQDYKDFSILVVDNGSTDTSVETLKTYQKSHGDITVVYNPKNFGFTGGVNTGIEWALNQPFDYVALFNNDAVAEKDWLTHLVNAIQPQEVGAATGLLLHADGKTIDTTGEQYSSWGLAFPRDRDKQARSAHPSGNVFGATGGATLYKTEMLRDIGMFDEDFFAYFEDVDISFRAQLAGWKIVYTPDAVAYHKQGATSSKLPGFAVMQSFKNLPLVYIKNVPRKLLFPIGIRFYFAYWMMVGNAILKRRGLAALRGVFVSIPLGFKKLPERQQIQKYKRVSTEYIKSILWNNLPPDQTGMRALRKFFTGK
jgi:GT2 family glycosyltransferase